MPLTDTARPAGAGRVMLYSHDTYGLGHLRRSLTIAMALAEAEPGRSALIVTGSPVAGRFDFAERVDHLRLPGVVKMADGGYQASKLQLDIASMVDLRGAVIAAAERSFAPDLLIVDKEPWGWHGELAPALAAAGARGCRIVLGLRDVLDEGDALAREWERKRALDAIERHYDEIWVYGVPEICRPLAGLGLSARMESRIVHTGYLRRGFAPVEDGAPDLPEPPYLLVTAGGGGDGAGLIDWVLAAYESDPGLGPPAFIVYGPFLDAGIRAGFDARIAALGGRVAAVSFHARLETLLAGAAGVVAMGGYNTFCEILSTDRPAIIVPRTRPRLEQVIRAAAAERLGLLRMLTPERDGADAAVMARAIRALADQPRPSAAAPPGLLDGLDRVAALARTRMPGPRLVAGG